MLRSAERKRRGWRAAAVAGVTAALLTAMPAGAEESGELQLGGFMTRIHSLPGLAEGPSGVPVDPGGTETGAGDNTVYPMQFAPPSVGLPLESSRINELMLTEGAAGASSALSTSPIASEAARSLEQSGVSYFTPRFSGLQFGATYAPPGRESPASADPLLPAGQEPALRSDFALGVNYLDTFQGVDVALTGSYRSASLPTAGALEAELSDQDANLERYSVGTSIGFSGLRLGGFYARDVGDGSISVQSWDAGVSYVSGPWTIGVDYLRSDFADARRSGAEGQDELQTVQAGLTYTVGPGIVASFSVLHSSLEDREGNDTTGVLGILGFSYNF